MIYLDNAATTQVKPKSVVEAVANALNSFGNAGRGNTNASLDAGRTIFEARENLATLFNVSDTNQIVFTLNSTEALNTAIKGIFKKNDHIITTELEHNSVLRPLYELEKLGVEVTYLKADNLGNINYDEIKTAIKSTTKGIIITHASNVTGNIIDIEKIGNITKTHNLLFIVDASQTAGIFTIDVEKMNIDVLCFTGHKSLLGPQGTGGLFVKKGLYISPLKTGGTGIQTFSREQPISMPTHLEAGTLNGHGIAGLNAGVRFILDTGIENLKKHELELMWYFYNEIKNLPKVKIYGDFTYYERAPIVSLNIDGINSSDISEELLYTYQISTRSGGHCAPLLHESFGTTIQGMVRFSFGYFNTINEVKSAVSAIKDILSTL